MYSVELTKKFERDVKLAKKRGLSLEKLWATIEQLATGEQLPLASRDHALTGNYAGFRECHIQPDWLLIYSIDNEKLVIVAARTGSHADLF